MSLLGINIKSFIQYGSGSTTYKTWLTDVFNIIDNGKTIYVWIGNGASKTERRFSMVYARRYLTNENKPCNFPIVTVREGKMTDEINSCFK